MKVTYLAIALVIGVGIGLLVPKFFPGNREGGGSRPEDVAVQDPQQTGADSRGINGEKGGATPQPPDVPPEGVATSGPSALPKREEGDGARATAEDFRAMMTKILRGQASQDEQLQFWEQARTSGHLAEVITELEEEVAGDEGAISARMDLAEAYTIKLLGVPAGPEKGLYAAKAEGLWKEVLKLEPNHYAAQYSIASSLSRYPEFLNRTGDAINEFEKAIAIQEQDGSEVDNPNAYLELSRLHLRDSNPVAALETLERAARRHPDNEDIGAQRDKLHSTYTFEEREDGAP